MPRPGGITHRADETRPGGNFPPVATPLYEWCEIT
jgi:hypothetical protein